MGVGTLQVFFFLMIRRPPRSTLGRSSAASDVYKRQAEDAVPGHVGDAGHLLEQDQAAARDLSLIHISEPTRQAEISYAVFCLKKKRQLPGAAAGRAARPAAR